MSLLFSFPLSVRWREMDALNHVNNAQYFSYVEEARVHWFKHINKDWASAESKPIVAAIHMDYRQPLLWPAHIEVQLFAQKSGTKSVTLGHRIVDANHLDIVYAEGYTVLVWINDSGTTQLLPSEISGLFSAT